MGVKAASLNLLSSLEGLLPRAPPPSCTRPSLPTSLHWRSSRLKYYGSSDQFYTHFLEISVDWTECHSLPDDGRMKSHDGPPRPLGNMRAASEASEGQSARLRGRTVSSQPPALLSGLWPQPRRARGQGCGPARGFWLRGEATVRASHGMLPFQSVH